MSIFLVLLWLFLTNSFTWAQLLLGLFLGWLLPLVAHPFMPDQPHVRHPLLMLRYLLVFLADILSSNWVVARLLLGKPERLRPAFIHYPVELDNDYAITLLASTISLTPGTVSAHYDANTKQLLIHALHFEGEEAEMISQIKQRYENVLLEIFQC
ncbi:Na+/H+ antiporter subunit E [Marinospirillum celere]|uniref:Na+/H+ antiporter subunit E n=1 Tax=Marinospirillum celere TaxID=1122252 RepID=UPI001FE2136A|nr:Na+/H+ antiporter subunit E [Marinospirillum celere]